MIRINCNSSYVDKLRSQKPPREIKKEEPPKESLFTHFENINMEDDSLVQSKGNDTTQNQSLA